MAKAYTTALNAAKWFLARNRQEEDNGADGISNLKIQKLLYYAQGCTLAITNAPLFDDPIVAWKHGPVVESTYHEFKQFESGSIDLAKLSDSTVIEFSDTISAILENVYQMFGQFSAWKLRNMTHEETPWMTTEKNAVIDIEKIKQFFLNNYIADE